MLTSQHSPALEALAGTVTEQQPPAAPNATKSSTTTAATQQLDARYCDSVPHSGIPFREFDFLPEHPWLWRNAWSCHPTDKVPECSGLVKLLLEPTTYTEYLAGTTANKQVVHLACCMHENGMKSCCDNDCACYRARIKMANTRIERSCSPLQAAERITLIDPLLIEIRFFYCSYQKLSTKTGRFIVKFIGRATEVRLTCRIHCSKVLASLYKRQKELLW